MFAKPKNNSKDLLGKTNRIVEGTKIKGDISSVADFRLDGELIGNFTSEGKIVIGPTGKIVGNITCKNADIEGSYEGKIIISELLTIKSKAKIKGEVLTAKLAVEPGAEFTASCQMKGTVKNISGAEPQKDDRQKQQETAL